MYTENLSTISHVQNYMYALPGTETDIKRITRTR